MKALSNQDKNINNKQNELIFLWKDSKDLEVLMTTTIIQNYYGG